MNPELLPAVVAGLVGGAAMPLFQIGAAAASRGPGFDLLGMWGRLLAVDSRAVGLAIHLAVSVAVAVLYAIGFGLARTADAGWAWGLIGGVLHWLVGGAFVGMAPGEQAARPQPPGPFGMRLGPSAAFAFLGAHLAYGLIVGVVYFALHSAGGVQAAF